MFLNRTPPKEHPSCPLSSFYSGRLQVRLKMLFSAPGYKRSPTLAYLLNPSPHGAFTESKSVILTTCSSVHLYFHISFSMSFMNIPECFTHLWVLIICFLLIFLLLLLYTVHFCTILSKFSVLWYNTFDFIINF